MTFYTNSEQYVTSIEEMKRICTNYELCQNLILKDKITDEDKGVIKDMVQLLVRYSQWFMVANLFTLAADAGFKDEEVFDSRIHSVMETSLRVYNINLAITDSRQRTANQPTWEKDHASS